MFHYHLKKNSFYSRHSAIISFKPKALIKLAHLKNHLMKN